MAYRPLVYEGNEPYIFVSYSHEDRNSVYRVLKGLEQHRYRFWYDSGISAGSEWANEIAEHLKNAYVVMFFQTRNSVDSEFCRSEVSYAYQHHKKLLSVVLEEAELTAGLELQLSSKQSVIRSNYTFRHNFMEKIMSCEELDPCKETIRHTEPQRDRQSLSETAKNSGRKKSIKRQLKADFNDALQKNDVVREDTISLALTTIRDHELRNRVILFNDHKVAEIIKQLIDQKMGLLDWYEETGRLNDLETCRKEAEILRAYLPEGMLE